MPDTSQGTTGACASKVRRVRHDCEHSFYAVESATAALEIICDQVGNGTFENYERLHLALHFVISPMRDAVRDLAQKLGLSGEDNAHV